MNFLLKRSSFRQAFAADDVEGDFEKDKQEILEEENPEPEKPLLLPAGAGGHIQEGCSAKKA